MKHTIFYTFAILSIGFLLYLNFSKSKTKDVSQHIIFTDKAPKPIGPYSQAVKKGNVVFVSGQVAIDPLTGNPDTADIVSETKQVMNNIRAILDTAGMTMDDISKVTIYMADLTQFKAMNEVYAQYFTEGNYPARETVQVAALPKNMHLEISVIAVR
jgi:2-iminobutanoate/2-iminopropanoate deaminase